VQSGKAEDSPRSLNTPGKTALYNNLAQNEELALRIDAAVKQGRPDGWRGIRARENIVKGLLNAILQNESKVERIFLIIRAQTEY
jgi:type I restriction enzyme R subunit